VRNDGRRAVSNVRPILLAIHDWIDQLVEWCRIDHETRLFIESIAKVAEPIVV
jgi:hypothetical protein